LHGTFDQGGKLGRCEAAADGVLTGRVGCVVGGTPMAVGCGVGTTTGGGGGVDERPAPGGADRVANGIGTALRNGPT